MDRHQGALIHVTIYLLLVASHIHARSLVTNAAARWGGAPAWGLTSPRPMSSTLLPRNTASCLLFPRGGSSAPEDREEDQQDDNDKEGEVAIDEEEPAKTELADKEEEEEEDEKQDDEKEEPSKKDITSMVPFKVLVKTNLGNKVMDQSFELNAVRTRNVESLKKSLVRLLPGKPPIELIRLLLNGQVLKDDMLVDELMDDEEEDDDNDKLEENKPALTLILDMVPPVDSRYATDLEEKLPETSTADLLEAYTLTEAAVWLSSQQLISDDSSAQTSDLESETRPTTQTTTPPLISFQARQYASSLRSRLEQHLFTEKASLLLDDPIPPAKAAAEKAKQPDVRGKRVRPGAAGGPAPPSSSVVGLKQTAQHFLNIHWGDTIRNFCLFLFFGWFGGRTVTSRALLFLGAPLCFIVQARPVKIWYKELLYTVLRNPPAFVLSLLPAPQQAMMSLSDEDAMQMIYGDDAAQLQVQKGEENVEKSDYDVMENADDEEDESDNEEDESDDEETTED